MPLRWGYTRLHILILRWRWIVINPRHRGARRQLPHLRRHLRVNPSSLMLPSTRATIAATCVVFFTPMPRLVIAGVPGRRPMVTRGGRGSKGMAFLLAMIPTASEACSA